MAWPAIRRGRGRPWSPGPRFGSSLRHRNTFADVRRLTTSVQEFDPAANQPVIWTSYGYDALGQLTSVVDDHGNTTTSAYDNLGRRTVVDSPDSGRTETDYDLASDVVAKITATLHAESKSIQYDCDFNRIADIRYPTFTGNDVTYTYGAPGAPNNGANRACPAGTAAGSPSSATPRPAPRCCPVAGPRSHSPAPGSSPRNSTGRAATTPSPSSATRPASVPMSTPRKTASTTPASFSCRALGVDQRAYPAHRGHDHASGPVMVTDRAKAVTITGDGVEIACVTSGPASGEPVILIHRGEGGLAMLHNILLID